MKGKKRSQPLLSFIEICDLNDVQFEDGVSPECILITDTDDTDIKLDKDSDLFSIVGI